MAFPVVEDSVSTTSATARTLEVDMPATVDAGDLLLVMAAVDNVANLDLTALDGFKIIESGSGNGTSDSHFIFKRLADGTEGGTTATLVVGALTNETISAICYRVSGGGDVEVAKLESQPNYAATVPNPTLTPSWGSDETLWFAVIGLYTMAGSPSAYSSLLASGAASSAGSQITGAYRQLEAASETPGDWSTAQGGSPAHISFTVGVRPAQAAGGSTVIVIES